MEAQDSELEELLIAEAKGHALEQLDLRECQSQFKLEAASGDEVNPITAGAGTGFSLNMTCDGCGFSVIGFRRQR